MPTRDYYVLLGIASDAEQDAVKAAYRRLAARYHPDRNPNPDAAARFREVQAAYDVLGKPEARASYDLLRQKRLLDDPMRVAQELWMGYVRKAINA